MITREFLDYLAVMSVMEDWGGQKSKIAEKIARSLGGLGDEESAIALEGLSMCYPGSVFVLVGGQLGMRTDGMVSVGVGHAAHYIEDSRSGCLRVRKERDPEQSKIFQQCISDAVANKKKFSVF